MLPGWRRAETFLPPLSLGVPARRLQSSFGNGSYWFEPL